MTSKWEDIGLGGLLGAVFAVCILRFILPTSGLNSADIYKDLAHVLVGLVLGLAMATKEKLLWLAFAVMCIVEVTAVLVRR